jgi:hypothetical protein
VNNVVAIERDPIYLPFVDYNVSAQWNGPLVPANFRTLIKLSDVVNWKHTGTSWLIVVRSFTIVSKEMAGSGFNVDVGVVLAVSPANVTVAYLEPMTLGVRGDDPQRLEEIRDFKDFPLSLRPTTPAGGLQFGVAASGIVVETAITNATPISNAAGVTAVAPAVGDLIMRVLKTSNPEMDTCRIRQFIQYRGA